MILPKYNVEHGDFLGLVLLKRINTFDLGLTIFSKYKIFLRN